VVGIHRTRPGPERGRLGFAAAVSREFGFLLGLGFHLVELNDTFARYEGDHRYIQVFHGRGSYELGVEIGHWVDVDGVTHEEAFPLRDVVALRCDPVEVGYGGTSATSAELVDRFIRKLAGWTREFAGPLLTDGDELFDELKERNAARYEAETDQWRASQLRTQADAAWRRKDFGTVVNAYSEIEKELSTVELRASERGRLRYARRALGENP
jgi:hypothetical protein